MNKDNPRHEVFGAMQSFGVNSVMFRNAIGKKLGLNITDIGCLNYMLIKTKSTPGELSRYTGLTSGATTSMLDRLEKLKFIRRLPNLKDRRGTMIELLPEARSMILPFLAGAQAAQQELLKEFSDDDLEIVTRFVNGFSKSIQDQADQIDL